MKVNGKEKTIERGGREKNERTKGGRINWEEKEEE